MNMSPPNNAPQTLPKISLYYFPNASSLAIHTLLIESQLEFRAHQVTDTAASQANLRRVSPQGLVPVLVLDYATQGTADLVSADERPNTALADQAPKEQSANESKTVVITETLAIATAISQLVPEQNFLGSTALETVRVYQWLSWMTSTVHAQGWVAVFRPERVLGAPFGDDHDRDHTHDHDHNHNSDRSKLVIDRDRDRDRDQERELEQQEMLEQRLKDRVRRQALLRLGEMYAVLEQAISIQKKKQHLGEGVEVATTVNFAVGGRLTAVDVLLYVLFRWGVQWEVVKEEGNVHPHYWAMMAGFEKRAATRRALAAEGLMPIVG